MTDSMKGWLEHLGLGDCSDTFHSNKVGLDVLTELTKDDLKELGVLLGDRLRLLKAIDTETGLVHRTNHLQPTPYAPVAIVTPRRDQVDWIHVPA